MIGALLGRRGLLTALLLVLLALLPLLTELFDQRYLLSIGQVPEYDVARFLTAGGHYPGVG